MSGLVALLLTVALCGCGNQDKGTSAASRQSQNGGYFKTQWQDESQFIVTAIVSDLAEMAYYAKHKRLPNPRRFSVTAVEKPGSPLGSPVYVVEVALDKSVPVIKEELTVSGPIWSPEIYGGMVGRLFAAVGLTASDLVPPSAQDDQFLANLTTMTARWIAEQNVSVSAGLTRQFRDAALHENAALLLGAFTLRENSGDFFDIRSPLCRLTAHLALARKLAGPSAPGLNGQVAKALLYTLMNNQKAALEKLALLETASPTARPWVRALRARNTDDYRVLASTIGPTHLEQIELFRASCRAVDPDPAWEKISDQEKTHVCDYSRIINSKGHTVETGHQLLAVSLAGELAEFAEAYSIAQKRPLKKPEAVKALNQVPERCFSADGNAQVRVIGLGQWAMFSQRHICQALQRNFQFMDKQWGVPDDARKFSQEAEKIFSGLRLYPFVRRFNATEESDYHRSVDEGFVVTVSTPHLVPATTWNYLCYKVGFAELYQPNPNPHLDEWFKHNPPPGTAYDPRPRLNHSTLVGRPDTVARLERLHELAPYEEDIAYSLLWIKYNGKATFEQMEPIYHPTLDYNSYRITHLAETVKGQPADYEKLMLKAAAIDPFRYYALVDYFIKQKEDAKAAEYLEKAMALHPDSVTAANESGWLVKYYQRNGMTAKALALADKAAETYSSRGLQTKAELLESLGKYDDALDYYEKIEERYNHSGELIAFVTRYKAKTGSTRFDAKLQARLKGLFPNGIQKVSSVELHGLPDSGVSINKGNQLLQQAGLQRGDIIVALYGIRVHNFEQYNYARESTADPEMDLIIYRNNQYLEVKASPPNHRFNADFSTWPGK